MIIARRLLFSLACMLLLAGFSLPTHAVEAPQRFNIAQPGERFPVNSHARYLIDESSERGIREVMRAPDELWKSNPDGATSFGHSTAAHWFHVPLSGLGSLNSKHYFQLGYSHHDEVDMYLVNEGRILEQYHTGDTRPFDTRPIDHRYFLFALNGIDADQADIYLRVTTGGPMQVPLDVLSQEGLSAQEEQAHLRFGAYFGIMLLMLFYNAVIFLFVRDVSYLFYILYIAATASLQFTINGLSFQFLWPESTTLNNSIILILTGLMPFTAIAFVWRFIGLRKIGTRLEKGTVALLCLGYTVVLTGNFTMSYMTTIMLAHALGFVSVTLGFVVGLKYWIKGIKAARIFAIAWFSYLVFILIYLLSVRSLIQSNFFTQHALEIGSIIELVLLSLAFADRINEEKDLRLKAQQKTNEELDEQVRVRTKELENANVLLQQISITDGLTGTYNRRHFDEVYAREYQRAYRDNTPIALILLDVDHFKEVNDTHGHVFGDLCLQRVADIIQKNTRRPPDTVARYGGEEFAVLLPNTEVEGAYRVAENIRHCLEKTPVNKDRLNVTLTASFGVIAVVPDNLEDPEWLLREADTRLYRAKDQGRNRVVA